MVEKANCRYVREHSQKQGHLRVQSGRVQTELDKMWKGERGARCSSQEAQGYKKEQVTKMVRLSSEEQPSPLCWRVQGRGQGMPARRTPSQVETEGCRENLAAKSTSLC